MDVPGGAVLAAHDGTTRRIGREEAAGVVRSGEALVCHAAFLAGRLNTALSAPLFDVLELFAYLKPARSVVPSPLGLAGALGLDPPHTPEEAARTLHRAAGLLIGEFAGRSAEERARLAPLTDSLARAGWRWGPALLALTGTPERAGGPSAGFNTWRELPEWDDAPPPGRPGAAPVTPEAARARLSGLVHGGEDREEQRAYAEAAAYVFGPREQAGAPRVALLEAGTGIGKTLGYLAPASLWSEANGPGLWISTYTRNLQRQLMQEIARLYPDPTERSEKAVVRKGRQNYLCILNFEQTVALAGRMPGQRAVALGLIARWLEASEDGDISGAGFPAFLAASLPLSDITDRRGECVHGACPHYRVCFIERVVRRARRAPVVVANHALVIAQTARDWISREDADHDAPERRTRYVFDEGHHLFDAADSGFSAFLSGTEMAELRRWIRGPEGRTRARVRGLRDRAKDLCDESAEARAALDEAVAAAGALAGEGWLQRIAGGAPRGPGELFLAAVHTQVRARSQDHDAFYSLEAETVPAGPDVLAAARELERAFARLQAPLLRLAAALRSALDDEAETLPQGERARIEAIARGIERRASLILSTWRNMLADIGREPDGTARTIDWFEIARDEGRDADTGMRRHWIDPTIPFAEEVLEPAHGALVTSATLRDGAAGEAEEWRAAEVRTGAHHLAQPPLRRSFGSPFRYAEQARIFVVRDVDRRDAAAHAAAFRELFRAAGGGAIGLFTAVRALKSVHARIAAPLAGEGLTLYTQHIDALDTGALVDLFRAEENACLLGTDALRDGIDVPGRSLRLIVFDKVPWPRPTILHKARRARFGKGYDDLLTRLRLKQAFGRLIRSARDRGAFVILEPATPTRLLSAFPAETPVKRCGLADAIAEIRGFLGGGGARTVPPVASAGL